MKIKKPEVMQEWDRMSKTDKKIFKSLPKRWRITIYLMFFVSLAVFLLWIISYIQLYVRTI